jgi:hypothetical protein
MVNEFQTPRTAETTLGFAGPDRAGRILNHESFQGDLGSFHRNL